MIELIESYRMSHDECGGEWSLCSCGWKGQEIRSRDKRLEEQNFNKLMMIREVGNSKNMMTWLE